MSKFKIIIIYILIMLFVASLGIPVQANKDDNIIVGMSTALTGPSEFLGTNMLVGVDTYFKYINAEGGVHGRKIKLIAYDDGYEPSKSALNMLKLIKEDNVLATIGNVGTPTAIPSIKISNIYKTPFFAPFTGADILRKNPPDKWIFNYRASYAEETAEMVSLLINLGIKPKEIAFFIQDDSFGVSGLKGGLYALKKYGLRLKDITIGRYKRNTMDIEAGLENILKASSKPKAVIMVGTYDPCAKFIIQAKDRGLDALFLNVSFVGSKKLGEKLAAKNPKYLENVIVTQVVPPYNSKLPVVKEYREHLKQYYPGVEPSFVSLEGYIAAKLFVHICFNAGKNLSKESFAYTAEKLKNYDPGFNYNLNFSKTNHQASDKVWVTLFDSKGKEISYDKEIFNK